MFYVFMFIWFLFVSHFMYIFYKKEFDIPDTLNWYKDLYQLLNKNKNLLKNKVSEDLKSNFNEIKEIVKEDLIKNKQELKEKEELKKNDLTKLDTTNCKQPEGFPINLCLSGALNKEEVMVREKIFKKIKTEPAFYHEGGQKKMILPLEALIFLNKGLNPLVNEQGEIILSIKEDQFLEDLKKIIMYLKAADNEVLYQSDEEVLDAIKVLAMLASENNLTLQQLAEITKNKLVLKAEEQGLDIKIESTDTEIIISKKNTEIETLEIIDNPSNLKEDKEATSIKESLNKTIMEDTVDYKKFDKKENFKDTQENIKEEFMGNLKTINQESKVEILPTKDKEGLLNNEAVSEVISVTDLGFPDISMEELMEQELKGLINEQTEEKKDNNITEFLHNLPWKEGSGLEKSQEKEGFEKNITSNISEFIQNIAKQKVLVFNDNKTNVFIDRKILIIAYSKLFGINYQSTLSFIERMLKARPEAFNQNFNQAIIDSLEEYVSDLIFGKKIFGVSYFVENNESYQGYGIWVNIEMFRKCLIDEEYDFFRSFPYNSNIKVGSSSKKQAELIKDYSNTEI